MARINKKQGIVNMGDVVEDVVKQIADKIDKVKVENTATWNIGNLSVQVDKAEIQSGGPRLVALINRANKRFVEIVRDDMVLVVTSRLVQYGLVDTGALRDSLRVELTGTGLDITYDVPYANLLHYGGYIQPYGNPNARLVYLPGRPWIEDSLNGYDFEAAFIRALSEV